MVKSPKPLSGQACVERFPQIVERSVDFARWNRSPAPKSPGNRSTLQMKKHSGKAGPRSGKPDRFSAHEDRRPPRFSPEISVLYEDDAVMVLDKPAGLLAVPIKGSATPSALSLLSARLKLKRQRAFVVHRIDRFTSGILLFAKTRPDRDSLVRQFLAHTPVRQYLAVLRGRLAPRKGRWFTIFGEKECSNSCARSETRRRLALNFDIPSNAFLRVLRWSGLTLVTGLQNQIRAQFSAIGHPVIGDRKYHPAESSER